MPTGVARPPRNASVTAGYAHKPPYPMPIACPFAVAHAMSICTGGETRQQVAISGGNEASR